MNDIIIYTDGCSLGNPGSGGYAAVIINKDEIEEISGGFRLTTNNRMELYAIIKALEAVKDKQLKISVITDSKLITDTINKDWLKNWKRSGWIKSDKKPVLNIDLWKRLDLLISNIDVEFLWVKGHSGDFYNERCDIIAKEAASAENLPIDTDYENVNPHSGLFSMDFINEPVKEPQILLNKKISADINIKVKKDKLGKTVQLEKNGTSIRFFSLELKNIINDLILVESEINKL